MPDLPSLPVAAAGADPWCILRTSGGRTLALARSLADAGIEVWTPVRIVKRTAPGHRGRLHMGLRKVMVEVATPILPGIVFGSSRHLDDLARAAARPLSGHPGFSIFHWGGRVPLVADRQIGGLRAAEDAATATIVDQREADMREAARQEKVKRLGSERARRKALRQERKVLQAGQQVTVEGEPALIGMVGTVVSSNGTSAVIHIGGALTLRVEAWQLRPLVVQGACILAGAAA